MPKKTKKTESIISSVINSRAGLALLLFFSLILIFNDLSKPGLPSNDDCAKARRAIEMIESGDILTPTLGGEPNFDHPPLYIALLSTGFLLFGKSAFAARFLGAVCALLTVYLIYIIGARIGGRKAGWWAGFFLTTSFFYIKIARRVQADIPFALFALAALYFFIRAYEVWQESEAGEKYNSRILKFMLLFGLFTGLSGLIKSVFIIFPLAAPFIFLLTRKQLKKGILLPYFTASALAVLTSGWWYLYSYIKHGELFIDAYTVKFLGHHISGGSGMGRFGYFGYLYEFMRHFLPWLPLLFIALYFFFRRKADREKDYSILLLIFGVLPIIVLSLAGDKAARYILFTYPIFLLFTALNILEKIKPETWEKLTAAAIAVLALLSAYVIIRPIDLMKIENEDYIILEQDIKDRHFTPGDTDLYHFGIDYNGNKRALIYYTGIKMKGLLTDIPAVQKRAGDKEPFYLIVENRDYGNDNYFKDKMRIVLNLKNRKILAPM